MIQNQAYGTQVMPKVRFVEGPEQIAASLTVSSSTNEHTSQLLRVTAYTLVGLTAMALVLVLLSVMVGGGMVGIAMLFPAYSQLMTVLILAVVDLFTSLLVGLAVAALVAPFFLLDVAYANRSRALVMDAVGIQWRGQAIAWQDVTSVHHDDVFVTVTSRDETIRLDLTSYGSQEVHRVGDRIQGQFQAVMANRLPAKDCSEAELQARIAIEELMTKC